MGGIVFLVIVVLVLFIALGVFICRRVSFIVREKGYEGDEFQWTIAVLFSPYGGTLLNALPNKRYQEQLLAAINNANVSGGQTGKSTFSGELPIL